MNNERIACLLIDSFALQMFYQKEPSLVRRPLALTEETQPAAPIVVVNQAAAENGVVLNSSVPQAHVVSPDLIVKQRDIAEETAQSQKLLQALQTIGPFVEKGSDNVGGALTVFMEVSGLLRLHKSETAIAEKIIALASSLGYPAQAGVADNKFIARVAAETSEPNRYTIVAHGAGDAFIEHLDIAHLTLSHDTIETLRNLGLRTVGRLAVFPTNEIAQRFGHEGTTLSHLSRGRDPQRFLRLHPDEDLSNEMHLTYRLHSVAAVVNHTEKLLPPLLAHLSNSGQGLRCFELRLFFENHHEETITISVEQPTRSRARLIRQLRARLERLKLPSPVTDLIVTIPRNTIAPLPSRQLNFDQRHHRQAGFMGNDSALRNCHLYTVTLNPTLLPELNFRLSPVRNKQRPRRTTMPATDSLSPDRISAAAYCSHNLGGLRLFPSPIETEVVTADGRPVSIRYRRGDRLWVDRRFGPWELSGGWWGHDFDRLYYELHTSDDRRYLFFYDRTCSRWFLQGVFD